MRIRMKLPKLHGPSLAYAVSAIGSSSMHQIFQFYYIKVFVNMYHIPEAWFQATQVIFMIWNTINDPLFGYCQDNYDWKIVKSRRHTILYGAPLFAISFLVPWFPWGDYSLGNTSPYRGVLVGLHLLIALSFYDTLFTFVLLARCALFTEMSQKHNDRVRLIRYDQTARVLASCSIYFCEAFSNHLEDFRKFQIMTVLVALLAWACLSYTGKHCHTEYELQQIKSMTKAESADDLDEKYSNNSQYSIWRLTWQILTQPNFFFFVTTNFCQEFHFTFLVNFTAIICDRLVPDTLLSSQWRSFFYGFFMIFPQVNGTQ